MPPGSMRCSIFAMGRRSLAGPLQLQLPHACVPLSANGPMVCMSSPQRAMVQRELPGPIPRIADGGSVAVRRFRKAPFQDAG